MVTNDDILNFLNEYKDETYKEFSSSLIPESHELIGVRLPMLRKYAKSIAKENNIEEYLSIANSNYFEEIMLQGLVIGYCKLNINKVIELCKDFVPKIDNWSICDSFCNSLKISKMYPSEIFEYIKIYINSNKPFEIRFLIVMLLNYYIAKDFLKEIFSIIEKVNKDNYYVKTSIAWLISVCYINYPKETLHYLNSCNLDKFTYNSALQKILDSFRVSDKDKNIIKHMKKQKYNT